MPPNRISTRVTPVLGGVEISATHVEADVIIRALSLYADSMRNTADMFVSYNSHSQTVARTCFARARMAEAIEYALSNPTDHV